MKVIGIGLTTAAPVLLAAGPPAGNLLETLEFIPGNAIRGLLAASYVRIHNLAEAARDRVFQRLFLTGETRYGFAYIEGAQVIPLSARTCKYDGGFLQDQGHGAVDLLLTKSNGSCRYDSDGSECGHSLDYLQGFYQVREHREKKVKKRLITRTAIDPRRGTAATGQLYSQRVLSEGQTFAGFIEIPDDLEATMQELIAQTRPAGIGTGRSRGQGWVKIEAMAWEEPDWGDARERAAAFHTIAGKLSLSITLLSDALVQDDYLRYGTAPRLQDLLPLSSPGGIIPEEWESSPDPSLTFAGHRLVSGFDGEPWHLPREPFRAVVAGSVFSFLAKVEDPHVPPGVGLGWIGVNNREGFGRAILWHPFHKQPDKEGD